MKIKKLAILWLSASTYLLANTPQAAANDDFGRLFSRPSERKNLDYLRQNQKLKIITPQDNAQTEPTEATPVELPAPVTLQGYVKRSDGASTLWINHKTVQENSAVDDVQIGKLHTQAGTTQANEGLNVKIPANGKQVRLKAGQMYVPETNQIRELKTVEKAKRMSLEETGVIGNDEKSAP